MKDILLETDYSAEGREGAETLATRIRDHLVDAITGGVLAPGSEIDEQALAQSFGASRTPVREALRELASAGLLIIEPRRGARVMEMTVDRIGELFELAAEIEAICVRFATHRITGHERALLSHIHIAAGEKSRAGDVDSYDDLNRKFHETIYRATHNRELQNHALNLRRRVAPFRRAQFRGAARLDASWAEHDDILQEIFAGDGDGAARLMRMHMLKAGIVYADYAQEHGTTSSKT